MVTQKEAAKYCCTNCDYYTSKKSNYEKHLSSQKHLEALSGNAKEALTYICDKCNKNYFSRHGLWSHKKKCGLHELTSIGVPMFSQMDTNSLALMFINTVKQNQELQKQSQDFQQKMFEMISDKIGSNNNNINCNNSISNKFNLNFFLNETCKDAMNIKEFIDSIQVSFEDVEYSGMHGFTEGMSRIFIRELNKLDVCKRPIHCTDVKREVFHIKDENNSWENERHLIFKIINLITRKNMFILKDWSEANPLCKNTQTAIHDRFVQLQIACLGPYDDEVEKQEYGKIISRVAKATAVDKKAYRKGGL
jgi:hypothetical protein